MSGRVLVRQGGADSAGTTDFNVFTGLKGAVSFDHPGTALISGGMRWADGEASAATFKILDPNGELPRTDFQFNLPAHALVTFTEDASGCPYWWHRGRMSSPTNSGRGNALAGNAVEFDATSDDGNVELKGQAFTEAWVRPQETDYARLVALQAYCLNGTSSTAPYHRDTCNVVVLDSGHFCKNANNVTMPATTYPIGTQPLDVVADCATTAGKDYGVVIHHANSPGSGSYSWDYTTCALPSVNPSRPCNTVGGTEVWAPTDSYDPAGVGLASCAGMLSHDSGSQAFAASPGSLISATARVARYNDQGALKIRFLNAGCTVISEVSSGTVSLDYFSFTNISVSGTAPAGTVAISLILVTVSGGGVGITAPIGGFTITGLDTGNSDCSHLCLQYLVPTDLSTNPCTLKISDHRSDIDEDTATPPTVYAPRWLDGKGTTGDTQDQLSGLVYTYQTTTGSGAIFTQNTSDVTTYDYWVESVSDSLVETPAEASARAPAILATRRTAHVTHKVSVPVAADQLHLFEAGMALQIKTVVTGGGQALNTYLTRRIVQTLKEPRNDGTYWVHMELNRPQRMVPSGNNIGGSVGNPAKAAIVSGTYSGQTVQQVLETLGTALPLTTLGDMLYRGAGGSNTRLPIGPSNTHLRSDGTKPVWSPESPALTNPMTTLWDLIRGGTVTAGVAAPTRFALGASNTILASDGAQFLWDVKPSGGGSGMTDPMTTIGDIIVRNASNVTARLGIGASNTVLTALGSGIAPVWASVSSGGGSSSGNDYDGKPNIWTPPTSANSMDDEFNDGSGMSGPVNGLNAKWSKHNMGTSTWLKLDDTVAPGAILFDIPNSQANDQAIYQAVPAGDFRAVCAMEATFTGDRQMWALMIVNTSGTGICVNLDTDGSQAGQLRELTTWLQTANVTQLNPTLSGPFAQGWQVHFSLRKASGVYYGAVYVGRRALKTQWNEVSRTPSAFTAAYVGVGRVYGGNVSKVALDYFRIT